MTRWHGTITQIGLVALARPTARGELPISRAMSPYERVSPYGILRSAAQTRFWKGVPAGESATEKSLLFPLNQASTCFLAAEVEDASATSAAPPRRSLRSALSPKTAAAIAPEASTATENFPMGVLIAEKRWDFGFFIRVRVD